MASDTSPISRQMDESWQRSLSAVRIKVDFQAKMFSERSKTAQVGQPQRATLNWTDDTANDFLRLLLRPNADAGNLARFRNARFDAIPTGIACIVRNTVAILCHLTEVRLPGRAKLGALVLRLTVIVHFNELVRDRFGDGSGASMPRCRIDPLMVSNSGLAAFLGFFS